MHELFWGNTCRVTNLDYGLNWVRSKLNETDRNDEHLK